MLSSLSLLRITFCVLCSAKVPDYSKHYSWCFNSWHHCDGYDFRLDSLSFLLLFVWCWCGCSLDDYSASALFSFTFAVAVVFIVALLKMMGRKLRNVKTTCSNWLRPGQVCTKKKKKLDGKKRKGNGFIQFDIVPIVLYAGDANLFVCSYFNLGISFKLLPFHSLPYNGPTNRRDLKLATQMQMKRVDGWACQFVCVRSRQIPWKVKNAELFERHNHKQSDQTNNLLS